MKNYRKICYLLTQSPMKMLSSLLVLFLFNLAAVAQSKVAPSACAECIRKNMEFLASDELGGRGSGTEDEHKAAEYIGSQLKAYGIQPAGDGGGFIQEVVILHRTLTGKPELKILTQGTPPASSQTFVYGKDFVTPYLSMVQFTGPIKKVESGKPIQKLDRGTVLLISGNDPEKGQEAAFAAYSAGAVAALIATSSKEEDFAPAAGKLPKLPPRLEGPGSSEMGGTFAVLQLGREMSQAMLALPDGAQVQFNASASEERGHTWNALGILRGTDPALQHAAVLFSAHLDHLGVGRPVNGDSTYNGADDDASGTTAVLEIARVLGAGTKPRRTVVFALFGSEEVGGLGSTYFREHPPIPLNEIAANLEFEMIGRPDPAVKADTVWLSGWERSNLGSILAEHGAHLVGDPHPEQDFFARSDNYVLAKKGVVAQTISSYGLHKEYHRPSDDLAHIDFQHMDEAIGSLLGPIEWLVNSDFRPQWNKGGQP